MYNVHVHIIKTEYVLSMCNVHIIKTMYELSMYNVHIHIFKTEYVLSMFNEHVYTIKTVPKIVCTISVNESKNDNISISNCLSLLNEMYSRKKFSFCSKLFTN